MTWLNSVMELAPLLGSAAAGVGALLTYGRKWLFPALLTAAVGLAGLWLWNDRWNDGYEAGQADLRAQIEDVTRELNTAINERNQAREALADRRNAWEEETDELERQLAEERDRSDDGSAWSLERVQRINRATNRSSRD